MSIKEHDVTVDALCVIAESRFNRFGITNVHVRFRNAPGEAPAPF